MLELAVLHKDRLIELFRLSARNPKYKWFHSTDGSYSDPDLTDDTWNREQYASLDSEGNMIGFIQADHCRAYNSVTDLKYISFTEGVNLITARDILNFIEELFDQEHLQDFFRLRSW